jgi:hypothetical protein
MKLYIKDDFRPTLELLFKSFFSSFAFKFKSIKFRRGFADRKPIIWLQAKKLFKI